MFNLCSTLGVSLLLLGLALLAYPFAREQSRRARVATAVVCHAVVGRYLWWRFFNTLPEAQWTAGSVAAYLVFALEAYMQYQWLEMPRLATRETDRSADADGAPASPSPLVDIFIPTYNEPLDILETSIAGALAIDHARKRVWVLDDGRRAWLRELAERKGARYVTRPSNTHYKSGNLNGALALVATLPEPPDFVAVFDADFVSKPAFLRRCLPLFRDERVGLVQTPQVFYNANPFQRAFHEQRAWPEDQALAFQVRMPCLDARDAAFCIGSSFVARFAALQAIGGFPTESVSEDLLTSMKLSKAGWRTAYLREWLSTGLAPEGLGEFCTQRQRWSLGLVEIARLWRTFAGGSDALSRVKYVYAILKWPLRCTLTVATVLLPAIFWLTDFHVAQASASEMVDYMLPLWIKDVGVCWLTRSAAAPIVSEGTSLLTSLVVAEATGRALLGGRSPGFRVTDKNLLRQRTVVHWRLLLPIVLLFAVTAYGMVHAVALSAFAAHNPDRWAVGFAWTLRGVLSLAVAAAPCIELPSRRSRPRFATDERARVRSGGEVATVRLKDISLSGAQIVGPATVGERVSIEVEGVGWIDGAVARATPTACAVAFDASEAQREMLLAKLYLGEGYIVASDRWSFWTDLKRIVQWIGR